MARTRKSIQPLNLYKYDVLIEDTGLRSDYFKISQFDGYFYGGRNAFLVAGAGVLQPNSKILVEILNKDGATVYSAPISQYIEGNSRLVQAEVYSDTPIGPGKIVLLGCTDTFIDGTPIPTEWRNKYNVRWITDVTISPLIENKTPIRFETSPSVVVEEKFYRAPSSSVFTEKIIVPVDVQLTPKYYNVFQNGYQIKVTGPSDTRLYSEQLNGILTGSITSITDSIVETASIAIPVTKIFNSNLAESQGSLIYTNTNKLIVDAFISNSGAYVAKISPLGTSQITSSLNLQYSKLQTFNTGSAISYAKLRVVDAKTLSGEINKVRISYKVATEPGEYVTLSDVNVAVQELLAVDSGSKIAETGKFRDVVINDYWYSATMSLQKNENTPTLPVYYKSSSLIGDSISLVQCCQDLLDAVNATPVISASTYIDNVAYFIGTRNENLVQLFPRSEYTLAFDAIVSKTSASVELNQSDYSLEVYLITQEDSATKLLEKNIRGQLLGTLTPSSAFIKQNFEGTEFNFTPKIIDSGKFGIRFVIYGGHWSIANVSIKPAQERFFSPDEIDVLVPNLNYQDKIITYKLQYLDVNNNSVGTSTISIPTYFTGSGTTSTISSGTSTSASYAATASFISHTNPGDNRVITSLGSGSLNGEQNLQFDGSTLSITGSMVVSGSATLRNIGPAQFTGSLDTSTAVTVGNSAVRLYGGGRDGLSGSSDIRANPDSGNLVISAKGGAVFFNYDHGTGGVIFSDGNLKTVATIDASGSAYFSGSVGIGTSTPSGALHVVKQSLSNAHYNNQGAFLFEANEAQMQIISDDSGNHASKFVLSTVSSSTVNKHWMMDQKGPGLNNRFDISYFTSSVGGNILAPSGVEKLTITTAGNVGIGTTTPGTTLHVQGNVSASDIYAANQTLSGSLYIRDNLFVYGSSSIQYVTSSQLNIGTNLITVNVQNPTVRFGGLAVIDSGSSPQRSGSLLFDSINDQWIFVHQNQTNPTSSVLLMGPQTYNNIGNETNLTNNYLLKSVNAEHVGDSQIYDNGTNVGIGTTVPGTKLDVVGTTRSNTFYAYGSSSLSGNILVQANNGASTAYWISTKTDNSFHIGGTGGTEPTAGAIVINYLGNVGIGTTAPSDKLHVIGAVSANYLTLLSTGSGFFGGLNAPTGDVLYNLITGPANGPTVRAKWSGGTTDRYFQIGQTDNLGNFNPNVTVKENYIGINTTAPSYSLDVNGAIHTNSELYIDNGNYIRFQRSTGGIFIQTLGIESGTDNVRLLTSGDLNITNGSLTNLMTVKNGGNVGIGTTSPTYKLDVNGTFRAQNGAFIQTSLYSEPTIYAASGINVYTGLGIYWYTGSYANFEAGSVSTHGGINYTSIGLRFFAGGVSTPKMFVSTSGNVGIGTLTPNTRLDVNSGWLNTVSPSPAGTANSASIYLTNQDPQYGILMGVLGTGTGWVQTQRTDGTATTYPLLLNPNGGNVGIGTTSPSTKLHVDGNIISVGGNIFTDTTSGIFFTGTVGSFTNGIYGVGVNNVAINAGGLERIRVSSNGKVIIGGTSEQAKLTVFSSDDPTISYGLSVGNYPRQLAMGYNTSSNYGFIISTETGVGYQPLALQQFGGNVGIGTTSPSYKLDVSGDIRANGGTVRLTSTNPLYFETHGGGWFMQDSTWLRTYNNASIWANTGQIGTNGGLTIGYGGNTAPSMGAIISGSVGIGTMSPGVKLEVAGTIVAGTYNSTRVELTSNGIIQEYYATEANPRWKIHRDLIGSAQPGFGFGDTTGTIAATGAAIGYPGVSRNIGFYTSNATSLVERVRIDGSGNVGISNTSPSYLLDVNGSARIVTSLGVGTTPSGTTGEIRATNNITAYYSDARLKNFVGKIDNALDKVNSINGYYFFENELAKSLGYNNDERQVGVSAQEIQEILPEVVTSAPIDDRYLTVRYEKLVPLLIEAIKELNKKIEWLENK